LRLAFIKDLLKTFNITAVVVSQDFLKVWREFTKIAAKFGTHPIFFPALNSVSGFLGQPVIY
jgi:hypothetical protein